MVGIVVDKSSTVGPGTPGAGSEGLGTEGIDGRLVEFSTGLAGLMTGCDTGCCGPARKWVGGRVGFIRGELVGGIPCEDETSKPKLPMSFP